MLTFVQLKLKTMHRLFIKMSILLLAVITIILPSACTLPWLQEDDPLNITSKFKATWSIHEKLEKHGDGSITYYSTRFGGLIGLVKEQNLPADWTKYESITFEFTDTTKVETQVLIGNTMRTWGRRGISKLTCYFDGLDMSQVDQVMLQTADPTTLTIKSVMLSLATSSWDSTPIWEGECVFGHWEDGFVIPPEQFNTALEGDKLEFILTTDTSDPTRGYWLIKSVYNQTDQTLEGNVNEQNQWGCTMIGKNATSYRVRLTAKDVKEIKKRGLFVNGYFVNVTQVNLLRKGVSSEEQEKREGEEDKEKYNQWQ